MDQQEPGWWEKNRRSTRLAPDKMELHIQVLEQYLGVETSHPLYQRVCPNDDELLLNKNHQKKAKRDKIPPLVCQVASHASKALWTRPFRVEHLSLLQVRILFLYICINLLFPLAYAAAATTSRTRSRTTGEVLGEERSSSRVSRNFRDVDWDIKISDEFRNIMAHNYRQESEQ